MRSIDINNKELKQLIADGYISVQKHPTAELYIYNYTHKCQFDKVWNEWTLMCRGLILDQAGNVVSAPFRKFFNIEELDQLPAESFDVFEKYDGSLGITYWIDDKPSLATRGSFTSEQALRGTELFRPLFDTNRLAFDPGCTYLFEIIYPENRIVVDYGKKSKLVLLAIINTMTGEELDIDTMPEAIEKAELTAIGGSDTSADVIKRLKPNRENNEGHVIRFSSGLRCKVKHEEYVRLHRLLTGVNERRIWEVLSSEGVEGIKKFVDRVPDEFYEWVRKTVDRMLEKYLTIEMGADRLAIFAEKIPTRKEQAHWLKDVPHLRRSIVFAMLDKKPYSHIIWKYLKPPATKPFKIEI